MPNPITDGQPINNNFDTFVSKENSDLKELLQGVLTSKFKGKSLADKTKLITCPDNILNGKDGLVLQILQKKAVPVYNLLATFGVVWVLDKVLPTATKEVAPLQLYLNLDKIKSLSNDTAFMALLNDPANDDAVIQKILKIMLPSNTMVGGKRTVKSKKYKKRTVKSKKRTVKSKK